MNKKSYIIILGSFVLVLIGLIIAVILKPTNNGEEPIVRSEEYLKYEKIFNFEISQDETYYIITKLKSDHANDHTVVIPNTIDNIPVKKLIGDNSNFVSWKNVKVIEIPDNIEYIGTNLENSDNNLADNVFIADGSLTVAINVSPQNKVYSSVDGVLFNKDQSILIRYPHAKVDEAVYLNYVVPNTVKTIYNRAFYRNERIASLTLTENVEVIGQGAFDGCVNLSQVIFNENLKEIGIEAFRTCAFKNIVLPSKLKSLGSRAFAYNELLQELFVPSSVKKFGSNIVSGCSNSLKITTSKDNFDFLKSNRESFGFKEITIKE